MRTKENSDWKKGAHTVRKVQNQEFQPEKLKSSAYFNFWHFIFSAAQTWTSRSKRSMFSMFSCYITPDFNLSLTSLMKGAFHVCTCAWKLSVKDVQKQNSSKRVRPSFTHLFYYFVTVCAISSALLQHCLKWPFWKCQDSHIDRF